jgi:hypothetical protein
MTIAYDLSRRTLADGAVTTVYATFHPRATTRVRVAHFPRPRRLDHWCAAQGEPEAIIGGFFLRDPFRPLGELRRDGAPVGHAPVAGGYAPTRAVVHATEQQGIALGPRSAFPQDPPATSCRPARSCSRTEPSSTRTPPTPRASAPPPPSSTPTSPSAATPAPRSASPPTM